MKQYIGIAQGKKNRASGELTRHIVAVMSGLPPSAEHGQHAAIKNRIDRPSPMQ